MSTVLVFGTFDLLHPGHASFLKQAREHGDKLVASVARDQFVRDYKGREPVHSQNERIEKLMSSGLVDEARLSDVKRGSYTVIEDVKPDVVCVGFDQHALATDLQRWASEHGHNIQIVVLSPFKPEKYKTSRLMGN